MATTAFSLRLDSKLRNRLEKEAKKTKRTAGFIANHAIRSYFQGLDQFNKELDEAVKEADKGIFISEEAINAWMSSWGTENELPPPEPDIFPETKSRRKVA